MYAGVRTFGISGRVPLRREEEGARDNLRAKGGEKGRGTNAGGEREGEMRETERTGEHRYGKESTRGMHGRREGATSGEGKGRWRTSLPFPWIPRYDNRSMRLRFAVPKWAGLEVNSRVRSRVPAGLTAYTRLSARFYARVPNLPLLSGKIDVSWCEFYMSLSGDASAKGVCIPSFVNPTRMIVLAIAVFREIASHLSSTAHGLNNLTGSINLRVTFRGIKPRCYRL